MNVIDFIVLEDWPTALAVGSFFWRLFPPVRRMDGEAQIDPSRSIGV